MEDEVDDLSAYPNFCEIMYFRNMSLDYVC